MRRIPALGHFFTALTCHCLLADLLLEGKLPEDQDVPAGVVLCPEPAAVPGGEGPPRARGEGQRGPRLL